MNHVCTTCGKIAESPGHLCSPCDETSVCGICGIPATSARHVCQNETTTARFVCGDCGMVSENRGQLCNPEPADE